MDAKLYFKSLQDKSPAVTERLEALVAIYKDSLFIDDSSGIKICTHEVNFYVEEAEFLMDSENLTASMFLCRFGFKVYSDIPHVLIAKANPNGFGYVPQPEWDVKLKSMNINPDVIRIVKWKLMELKPVDY